MARRPGSLGKPCRLTPNTGAPLETVHTFLQVLGWVWRRSQDFWSWRQA